MYADDPTKKRLWTLQMIMFLKSEARKYKHNNSMTKLPSFSTFFFFHQEAGYSYYSYTVIMYSYLLYTLIIYSYKKLHEAFLN